MLEMVTDPMLKQWVPAWVVEQYRRGNPFCQEVLTALQAENLKSNRALVKKTKREMIRRHRRHLQKMKEKKAKGSQESSGEGSGGGSEGESTADEREDVDAQAEELAAKLAGERDDDPHAEPVELLRDARPQAGSAADGEESDLTWARRSAEERLSAAGAAPPAPDRAMGVGEGKGGSDGDQGFGVLFKRNGDGQKRWNALPLATQDKLRATEQLFFRLSGYAVFSSTVFGIGLWRLYQGHSYDALLGEAGRRLAVGLSLPVWDPAALLARLDLLRWPSDLDLFRNIPAFVSLGFIGIETVPKLWRRIDRYVIGTTGDAYAALVPEPASDKERAPTKGGGDQVVHNPLTHTM